MILTDGVSVVDFQERLPYLSSLRFHLELELIGGQNRTLFVACKRSFFQQKSVKKMISTYVPVPAIARISMSLIHTVMQKLDSDAMMNITIHYLPIQEGPRKVSEVPFSAFLAASNEELCTIAHLL